MTAGKLRERDRRALTLGALVMVPALAWTLAARPALATVSKLTQTLEGRRDLLARELRIVAEAPSYPVAERAARHDLEAIHGRLFANPSEGAASAALGAYLKRHATRSEVRVLELRAAPVADASPRSDLGLRATTLRLLGESDLEGLATMLAALETGPRLVHVDDLEVQPGDGDEVEEDRAEVLSFEFSVTAFALDTVRHEPARRPAASP